MKNVIQILHVQKLKKRWVTRMLASFLWRKPAKKAHPVAGPTAHIFCTVQRNSESEVSDGHKSIV
ncbi:MAG: hypothetical protein V4700_04535 [Pseudomonadota bacterium]